MTIGVSAGCAIGGIATIGGGGFGCLLLAPFGYTAGAVSFGIAGFVLGGFEAANSNYGGIDGVNTLHLY